MTCAPTAERLMGDQAQRLPRVGDVLYAAIARVPDAGVADFARYEDRVLARLDRYGGTVERRLQTADGTVEIHVLRFDAADGLERYRNDQVRVALAEDLERCGATIELFEVAEYSHPSSEGIA